MKQITLLTDLFMAEGRALLAYQPRATLGVRRVRYKSDSLKTLSMCNIVESALLL